MMNKGKLRSRWNRKSKLKFIVIAFVISFSWIYLCSFRPTGQLVIFIGVHATATERASCEDLRMDLQHVTGKQVYVKTESDKIDTSDQLIVLGTPATSSLVKQLCNKGIIKLTEKYPGSGGGIIKVIHDKERAFLLIAGNDVEGLQNCIYDFSTNQLHVDPFAYWTGSGVTKQNNLDLYSIKEKIVMPPAIPVICYFENDVDELANMRKPYLEYDMETWEAMINSLRRVHYNSIQLFDMLGRPEFFIREPYKELRPDYHVNLPLVDSFIDYAHLKGMKVQVDMSLGYEMRAISDTESLCWTRYKKEWLDTWVYYLTQTPLGKADIFSLRPRNQIWDREYKSSCGEDKVKVFNEVFNSFDSILARYKPSAQKICICYGDGMEMFNAGFSPPKDFILAWSDNGYCDFESMPGNTVGYDLGTYMHAGFWKNHTVHDPYPEKIDSMMTLMLNKYKAGKYLQVNGQTFRPFLLNLEAFSQWAYDPSGFDGQLFYRNWCNRYFDRSSAPYALSSMQSLHEAQFGRNGYVQNLSEIRRLINFLSSKKNERVAAKIKEIDFISELPGRLTAARRSFDEAAKGLSLSKTHASFYHDYVYLPALMYKQMLEFENTLVQIAEAEFAGPKSSITTVNQKQLLTRAADQLDEIYKTCATGDKNKKWAGWYDPKKRRPNNGFPTMEMINEIKKNLFGE